MAKGTFQERLARAIQVGDVVTILRTGEGAGEEEGAYRVVVTRDNKEFGGPNGKLKGYAFMLVRSATPGALARAIEGASMNITLTVNTIQAAQE